MTLADEDINSTFDDKAICKIVTLDDKTICEVVDGADDAENVDDDLMLVSPRDNL